MSGPRLLFDENLSPRLVTLLAEDFPESTHVDSIGLHGKSDEAIWRYAQEHGLVLVSKDNDFRQLSFLRGAPPKVVWLRIGNSPTAEAATRLRTSRSDIALFVQDAETALLSLSG